jgi:hypothetical protein
MSQRNKSPSGMRKSNSVYKDPCNTPKLSDTDNQGDDVLSVYSGQGQNYKTAHLDFPSKMESNESETLLKIH